MPIIHLDPRARDETTLLHVALYELHAKVAAVALAAWRYKLGLLGAGLAVSQRKKLDREIEQASAAGRRHERFAVEHLVELQRRRCRVRSVSEVLGEDGARRLLAGLTRAVLS
jgi:hypothetical protein